MSDQFQNYKYGIQTLNGSGTTPSDATGYGAVANQNWIAVANNFDNAGLSGYSGAAGAAGTAGVSGYSGKSGLSGYSGVGISGYSGLSGQSGYSGASGNLSLYLPLAGGTMTGALTLGATMSAAGFALRNLNNLSDKQATPKIRLSLGGVAGTSDTLINDSNGTTQIDISPGTVTINGNLVVAGSTSLTTVKTPSWTGYSTIFVDPVNGDDAADGSPVTPFQTISGAIGVAAAGDLILVSAGTFATPENQIVLPDGVHLRGMGLDITVLKPSGGWIGSNQSPYLVPGAGSVISDLTVDLTSSPTTNRPAAIGCNSSAAFGSTSVAANPSLYRVKSINSAYAFQYQGPNTTNSFVYLEDSIFISNLRCANYITGSAGFLLDAVRCQFLFIYSGSVSNSQIGECLFAQANPTRLFNCILSMTDTVHTSWSSVNYQMIDADAPLELYGCTCIGSFLSLPAILPTVTAGFNPGFWFLSNTNLTKLGAGNTLSLPESDAFSPSLYQLLASPKANPDVFAMTVSSSAITPVVAADDSLWEIAVDAGTLTSSTLTINNVNVSNNANGTSVALVDGQRQRFRIKNTNGSSTAMTLAFGTSYNNGSTSVSTIAAGKRAYLTYCYDGDNSKWDLIGYVSGV